MGVAERKEREKQKRKELIIRAAEKVFFSQGFERSTMDDIAEEAELSKGTLYLYFKSKEDLHISVVHKVGSRLKASMMGIENLDEDAFEKLVSMGRATIEFANKFPDQMKSIMLIESFELQQTSYSTSQLKDVIFKDSPVGIVIRIVEQGVKEKLIRADIPAPLIAHTLWMQMLSVVRFVSTKSTLIKMLELTPVQVYESHFELVLNGIRS